jgi:putative peptidoglycan lipid II flippase
LAANVFLKIVLVGPLAQVGLALATSAGAWINLALLLYWADRRRFESPGVPLERVMRLVAAGVVLGAALFLGERYLRPAMAGLPALREEALLLVLLIGGGAIYAALVVALVGRRWLRELTRDTGGPAARPERSEAE